MSKREGTSFPFSMIELYGIAQMLARIIISLQRFWVLHRIKFQEMTEGHVEENSTQGKDIGKNQRIRNKMRFNQLRKSTESKLYTTAKEMISLLILCILRWEKLFFPFIKTVRLKWNRKRD